MKFLFLSFFSFILTVSTVFAASAPAVLPEEHAPAGVSAPGVSPDMLRNRIAELDEDSVFIRMSAEIQDYLSRSASVKGQIEVVSYRLLPRNRVSITFSKSLSEYRLRDSDISQIRSIAASYIPEAKEIHIYTDGHEISELKSYFTSTQSEKGKSFSELNTVRKKQEVKPLVRNLSDPAVPTAGLAGKHIALWQSHGYYYEQKLARWEWQRARLFGTVEDMYTQSYVLPFLVPMLENAGACTLLPRERDLQRNEVIVDNDSMDSGYSENPGADWSDMAGGFADSREFYVYGENPFAMGTARVAASRQSGKEKKKGETDEDGVYNIEDSSPAAVWTPDIPENGNYAVYVSYKTLPNSTDEAIYTVRHNGGSTVFAVNQQMGGGTWVYLGTFGFSKGSNSGQGVELSNVNGCAKSVVTADAVRFGGGMGNMARKPNSEGATENVKSSSAEKATAVKVYSDFAPECSGYPRYAEGARYWLQWAGYADSVYSYTENTNDYIDDYMARGRWVNALAGGSYMLPDVPGLGIPVDMSFAFHSDAGTMLGDSIVGSLVIYTETSDRKINYRNGTPRLQSRELADLIQSQIVNDVRAEFTPEWTRRGMWNRQYAESRIPEVPSVLLELLSHQNIGDMIYGLNPEFHFTVSRAVYKGILKYMSLLDGRDYVVQPLPVNSFSATIDNVQGRDVVRLNWKETIDNTEPTATPKKYIVYTTVTNVGDSGEPVSTKSDAGIVVTGTSVTLPVRMGNIYRYNVVAVNEGGRSFPSETLSVGLAVPGSGNAPAKAAAQAADGTKGAPERVMSYYAASGAKERTVMIVNGFTKVSAPGWFGLEDSLVAGFNYADDHGIPYIKGINYIGDQHDFRRSEPWIDDDNPGFGATYSDYEGKVMAGNSFDYAYVHGRALMKAGYSFVSASRKSIEDGLVSLEDYRYVDLILGKQAAGVYGKDTNGLPVYRYGAFGQALMKRISDYCSNGGNLIVSGAFVGSDLWDNAALKSLTAFRDRATAKAEAFRSSGEGSDGCVNRDSVAAEMALRRIEALESELAAERDFAEKVLKYNFMARKASAAGKAVAAPSPYGFSGSYSWDRKPNTRVYAVESVDGIVPVGKDAYTVMRYADSRISAGVAYHGNVYNSVVLSFPIESLGENGQVDKIMSDIMKFFSNFAPVF